MGAPFLDNNGVHRTGRIAGLALGAVVLVDKVAFALLCHGVEGAGLLAQANSLPALQPLTQLLGFAPAERVSRDAQRTLSIDQLVADATIARGPGRLRCLSAVLVAPESLNAVKDTREQTRQLCHAVCHIEDAR